MREEKIGKTREINRKGNETEEQRENEGNKKP
jgi:hypothetical protein